MTALPFGCPGARSPPLDGAKRVRSALRALTGGSDEDDPDDEPAASRLRFESGDGLRAFRSPIERAGRALGTGFAADGSAVGSHVGPLRAFVGREKATPPKRNHRRGSPRFPTDVAVLGRAAVIALATLAGSVGPSTEPTETEANGESPALGRRLRESGPVVLVPLAWFFAIAAHLGCLESRTVVIAHLVMDCVLVAFAAASWSEMTEGVLRAWKFVLLVGLGFTLLGTGALLDESDGEVPGDRTSAKSAGNERTLALVVQAWLLAPAAGLAYTGLRVGTDEAPRVYLAGGALSALGSLAYASAPADEPSATGKLLGLAIATVGQTAAIANAVYQY